MKSTGIVRRIDDLGRVVIPKEIRRAYGINESDPLEIYADKKGIIELRKYNPNIEEEEKEEGSDPAPIEKTVHVFINKMTDEAINEDRANAIISQYTMEEENDAQTQIDFFAELIEGGNDDDILLMVYHSEEAESSEARKRYFASFHDYCSDIASERFYDEYSVHTVTIPC